MRIRRETLFTGITIILLVGAIVLLALRGVSVASVATLVLAGINVGLSVRSSVRARRDVRSGS
jgi:hypothetical protein